MSRELDYRYNTKFGMKCAMVKFFPYGRVMVKFENGDISFAHISAVVDGKVLPKFTKGTNKKDCICKYDDFYIRQLYFDYKEECYVLATIDGELLKVSREGVLIDRIQD